MKGDRIARIGLTTLFLAVTIGIIFSSLPQSSATTANPQTPAQTSASVQPYTGTPSGTYFDHVVVIIMEDKGIYDICLSSPPPCSTSGPAPFMARLANNYTIASQYLSLIGTSQPNYVALLSGSLQGCSRNGCPVITSSNLVDRFDSAGLTWKGYMEDQTPSAGCDTTNHGFYNYQHNPFVQFQDITNNTSRCNKIILANPSSCGNTTDCALINDLNNASAPAPSFMWLTPNDCNNMHSDPSCTNQCTSRNNITCITDGDNYLKSVVPNILNSSTFTNTRSALFVVFDEGNGFCPLNGSGEDCIYASWSGPQAKTQFGSKNLYNQYSFTKTIEANWNLPSFTVNDTDATPMTEFFKGQSADFFVAANPSSLTIANGVHATSTVHLTSLINFTGTVSLSATSSPSGLTLSLNPTSVSLPKGGNANSTLTVSSTIAGHYSAIVKGTSGSLSHNTTITVTILPPPNFAISTTPGSLTIGRTAVASTPVSVATTGDRTFFEASYLSDSFYAQGRYWLFYEDSSINCENQGGCLLYTTSTDGVGWTSPTNVNVHVTDSDFSVYTDGSNVFYARYNETTFESDCGRNLQFRTGALSSTGTITWQPEQTALVAGSAFSLPNEEIIVDSNGQAWIAFLSANEGACGGSGTDLPQIIHSSGTDYASWTTPTTLSTAHSNNWHVALASLGSGQVYASYWIVNTDLHGRLYNGTAWLGDEQISSTSTKNDVNAWLFNSGANVYAVYFDNATETYRFAARTSTGTWIVNTIGTGETHTGAKAFNPNYYSLPDTASYDPTNNQVYLFYMNATTQKIDQWRGFGNTWTKTNGTVSTLTVPYPDSITSFIQPATNPTGALFYTTGAGAFTIYSATLSFTTKLTTGQFITSINSLYGFTGTVNLSTTVSPPSGLTVSCSPASISGGFGSSYCSLTSTASGSYTVTVTGKSGSLTHSAAVSVTVPGPADFAITSTTPPPTDAGQSANSTITVAPVNGFSGTVTLTDTVPSGLTCGAITPNTITTSGTATVSCSSTTAANYTLTITGTSGSLTHNAAATFRFQNFTITATSPTGVVGSSVNSTITIQSVNGFAGTVSLTDTVPSGLTCGSITPSNLTGTGTATIACSATVAGNYTLTITGTSGPLAHNATATYHIQDFTIAASTPIAVDSGQSSTTTITIAALNHFSATVNLTDTVPTGLNCGAITPNSLTGSGSATISCSATAAGNYTLTLTATSGSLIHSTTATFTFRDFTIAATSPATTDTGQQATATINITALNHFNGTISLTDTVPSGLVCGVISPTSVIGSGTATISCTASIAGNYTLTITGTSTPLAHTTTAVFMFENFTITATSPAPVDDSQSATSTIAITSLNHFAGNVTLTDTIPAGLSCSTITPSSLIGSGAATLSCTASVAGNYTVTITGTSIPLVHSVTAVFRFQDFNITATSPPPVDAGASATSTLTITGLNNFPGTISLTDTVPSGLTCGVITPNSIIGSGTATLSCTSTVAGNYTVNVTGTSSPLVHLASATFSFQNFTITASSPTAIDVGQSATSNIALTALNNFNGTITLTDSAPSGLTCGTVTPTTVTGFGTATVSCTATMAGNYTLTITGTSGPLVHTAAAIFMFQNFTLTSTSPAAVDASQSATSIINVTSLNHFAGTVSLTDTVPNGLTCGAITPSSLTGYGTATLSCSATVAGNYTVTITGTSTPLVHVTTATFMFQNFTITATSPAAVDAGQSATSTIALTALNHFNGTITLTDAVPSGLACGAITPTNIAGSGTATVTCTATVAGNYTLTMTGTSTPLVHIATALFMFQNFTTTATSPAAVDAGQPASSIITLTSQNHFNGTITLTDAVPASLTCGAINPASIAGSGTATVSCTATIAGNYTLTITATSSTLVHIALATFTFQNFTITSSSPAAVDTSQSANSTITITPLNHFTATVDLSDSLPTGLTCTPVTPSSIAGSGTATLSCTASVAGNYTVTITGTSGTLAHSTTTTFSFRDFNITATSPAAVDAGVSTTSTITVTGLNRFSANVTLTATLPTGLTCGAITPNSITGSGTATLSCSSTTAGNYTVTITATSSALVHNATTTFRIQDYTVTATSPVAVDAGQSATSNLTVTGLNHFSGNVTLTDVLPSGLTCGPISPGSIIATGTAAVSCSSTIAGNYTLTVTGTSTPLAHTATITFRFQDFNVTATSPSPALVTQPETTTITITSLNHFNDTVNLTDSVPAGLACGPIVPSSVTGSGSASINCSSLTAGNYTVTITATSSPLVHNATAVLQFQDFTIVASTVPNVDVNQSPILNLTITPVNHFSGGVSLTDSVPAGLACGPIVPNGITASGTATVSCTAAIAGNYTLTVTGASGALSHSATATFRFQDFTIAAVPTSVTVNAGAPGTSAIHIGALNGFLGLVNLTTNSTACTLSPTTETGSGVSTLSCTLTTPRQFTIVVTGTSGALSHNATVPFKVQDFTIQSIPSTIVVDAGSSGTSIIQITGLDGFAGTVNLAANNSACTLSPVIISGPGNSTLSCSFASPTTFSVTVNATSSQLLHSTIVTFKVQAFVIFSVSPSPANVGTQVIASFTVTPLNGFNGTVSLTDNVPAGLTCGAVTPSTVTGSGSATATCTTSGAGNYTLTVTGTSGTLINIAPATFQFQDFALAATSPSAVDAGASASSTITITPFNRFGSTVSLTDTIPAGLSCGSITPASISPTASATISCSSNIAGNYTLTIRATSGSLTHTANSTIQVQDFAISPLTSTAPDQNGTFTVNGTITALNGFRARVVLSRTTFGQFSCQSFVPAIINGSGSFSITCSAFDTGSGYVLTITGTSGPLSHTQSITVNVGSVGGVSLPVDKLKLLTPFIPATALLLSVLAGAILLARRSTRKRETPSKIHNKPV